MSRLLTIEVYAKDKDAIVFHLQEVLKRIQEGYQSGYQEDETANEYYEYNIE